MFHHAFGSTRVVFSHDGFSRSPCLDNSQTICSTCSGGWQAPKTVTRHSSWAALPCCIRAKKLKKKLRQHGRALLMFRFLFPATTFFSWQTESINRIICCCCYDYERFCFVYWYGFVCGYYDSHRFDHHYPRVYLTLS